MLTEEQKSYIGKVSGAYCDARVPIWVRDEVALQFRIRGHDVVLFEKRPLFRDPSKWIESNVAKFRLNSKTETWSLFWRDRQSKWHRYERCEPSPDIAHFLQEVDRDPTGIFWG